MADVFLSYSRSDSDIAKHLAKAFESRNLSVWWDNNISIGSRFDHQLEEALEEARTVVVLWSKSSVSSAWVRAEAEEGLNRGVLVPILLEDIKLPLIFRTIQAIKLLNWDGHENSTLLDPLYEALIKPEDYSDNAEEVNNEFTPSDYFSEYRGDYRLNDIVYPLVITLREAIQGTTKRIEYKKQSLCTKCNGSLPTIGRCSICHGTGLKQQHTVLEVKIPSGVDTYDRIRLAGEGNSLGNPDVHSTGDVYIEISVQKEPNITRNSDDLYTVIPVTSQVAFKGGKIEVSSLFSRLLLTIPKNLKDGTIIRLHGQGIKSVNSEKRGNMYCRMLVISND